MRPSWRCETHRGQVVEYRLDRLSHLVEAARKGKVAIEIALITEGPGEAPPHPLAIPQELLDRRSETAMNDASRAFRCGIRLSNASAMEEFTGQPSA
jgi:hypothetical protein